MRVGFERDRRKDFTEKTTTDLAAENALVVLEKLPTQALTKRPEGRHRSARGLSAQRGLGQIEAGQADPLFLVGNHRHQVRA